MRRFAVGRLSPREREGITIARKLAAFRAALARPVEQGRISVDLRQEGAATVDISFSGLLDRRTARLSARHLRRLLKETGAELTLRLHAIEPSQVGHWDRMLRRLRRHGDRISIVLDKSLRDFLPIDSSVFHLALPIGADAPIHLER
jgi:hypothetical protein